jgi:hypothetical protein
MFSSLSSHEINLIFMEHSFSCLAKLRVEADEKVMNYV